MRIRRVFGSVSTFVNGLAGAVVKAVATGIVLGVVVVFVMHYVGVPVPGARDLVRGLSSLARSFS